MSHRSRTILFAVTASVSLRFLAGQLSLLKNRGWQVAAASGGNRDELHNFAAQEKATAYPLPLKRPIAPLQDMLALAKAYYLLRQIRPTVTNVGTPKAGLVVGLAAALARIPVRVYTLHGLRLETVTGPKRQILELTERLAMAAAHRVVCVSPSLQRRVHELGLAAPHKTLVLGAGSPNGVPLPSLQATAEQAATLRNQLGLEENAPTIGFVGRFARDKGMAELITAYRTLRREIPALQLLLIGDFEEGDPVAPWVREAIETDDGVVRTGYVPDVTPYYSLMSVLCLPTYREGFPTVALEAAASGVALVTTDATGATDSVKPGLTGWRVPVGDTEALIQALREAVNNPEETAKRGAAGRDWVSRDYNPAEVQRHWVELYDQLLNIHEQKLPLDIKRVLDIILSGAGLTVLSLPMLGLAALVRVRLGSPVLFAQVRPGLGGELFTMYKFRTMTDERGPDGTLLPDAERLTPFGRFLRATSLDELPELYNVFKGEMSLVGPRPLHTHYLPLYNARQARRHEVRPGITGWAQINGRNALSWEERFELDVWYVDNRNILLDLKILLMTLKKVVIREGISASGEATMFPFTGTPS